MTAGGAAVRRAPERRLLFFTVSSSYVEVTQQPTVSWPVKSDEGWELFQRRKGKFREDELGPDEEETWTAGFAEVSIGEHGRLDEDERLRRYFMPPSLPHDAGLQTAPTSAGKK